MAEYKDTPGVDMTSFQIVLEDWDKQIKTTNMLFEGTGLVEMEKSEMIYIASKYAEKGYDYEQLCYGYDLYGRGQYADDVWDFVIEYKEIGSLAFREKYKNYKLY